ncbi:MAG: ChbG/HpnK family deacetylase [Gemmatimonadota bacterium]
MDERRLIINADDFGITDGVTRGIAEAIARGIVTSTSVMVNMPGWNDAAARLRDASPACAYGLHLNLVAGRPLTTVPSLVDARTGRFHALPRFVFLAIAGALRPDDIAAECSAQLERLRGTGICVSHADSHRHVHALPVVARAMRAVLGGLPLRRPREALARNPLDLLALAKKVALALALGPRPASDRSSSEVDHFVGVSLQDARDFAERLHQLVDSLDAGTTELMVHPGYVDQALIEADRYVRPRERELRALLAPALRERLVANGVRLVTRTRTPAAPAPRPLYMAPVLDVR